MRIDNRRYRVEQGFRTAIGEKRDEGIKSYRRFTLLLCAGHDFSLFGRFDFTRNTYL